MPVQLQLNTLQLNGGGGGACGGEGGAGDGAGAGGGCPERVKNSESSPNRAGNSCESVVTCVTETVRGCVEGRARTHAQTRTHALSNARTQRERASQS